MSVYSIDNFMLVKVYILMLLMFWWYHQWWFIGTLHNSSLVLDESRSKLNYILSKNIKDGKYKYLNLLGVDNVCDSGLDILAAIQEYFYWSERKSKMEEGNKGKMVR